MPRDSDSSISRKTRILAILLAPGLALGLAAGCGGNGYGGGGTPGGGGGTADAEFVIQPGAFNQGTMAFVPDRDTVRVGQVVRMRNSDSLTHSIQSQTAGGPSWGNISAGAAVDRTAATAGSFTFACVIAGHTMSGILVVLP